MSLTVHTSVQTPVVWITAGRIGDTQATSIGLRQAMHVLFLFNQNVALFICIKITVNLLLQHLETTPLYTWLSIYLNLIYHLIILSLPHFFPPLHFLPLFSLLPSPPLWSSSPLLFLLPSSLSSLWQLSAIINGSNIFSPSCGDPKWQITGDTHTHTPCSLLAGLILPHNGTRLMFSSQLDKPPFVCLYIRDCVCVWETVLISDFEFLGRKCLCESVIVAGPLFLCVSVCVWVWAWTNARWDRVALTYLSCVKATRSWEKARGRLWVSLERQMQKTSNIAWLFFSLWPEGV